MAKATINLADTRTLLEVVERGFKPTTTLVDTFFPNVKTFVTEFVDVEYKKGGRKLAPFIVPGSKGINVAREGSTVRQYKAPLMRPKRVIEVADVIQRGFGEDVYSKRTPEERAQEMRARDLADLIDMCARRQEWMAAQLLINGSYEIEGYADDGNVQKVDTVTFDFDNKVDLTGDDAWSNSTADIYGDISTASQTIRRNSGEVPTVAIMSPNIAEYLVNNEALYKWLLIPNRDNLAFISLQPRLQRPELLRVGMIQSLNIELYTYDGIYVDEAGTITPYLPDNYFILGVPGRGSRLFGAVTQMEADNSLMTYEGEYIPKVTADIENDVSALAVSSRCVVVPEWLDDWYTIHVAEEETEESETEEETTTE